jgi:hypothetical protein
MVDHRIDHRKDDLWTEHERRVERESSTSVVAGGILIAVVLIIALAFAFFGLSRTPEQAGPVQTGPAAGETSAQ